jgi:hypothetical protein
MSGGLGIEVNLHFTYDEISVLEDTTNAFLETVMQC